MFLFWGLLIVLWEGGWILDAIKNHLLLYIYPECIFSLIICNFYMFFTFVLAYVSVCVSFLCTNVWLYSYLLVMVI